MGKTVWIKCGELGTTEIDFVGKGQTFEFRILKV